MTSKKTVTSKRPSILPKEYPELLKNLKKRIQTAQLKAAIAVNQELITLYWDIGKAIVERQKNEKWGAGVIEKLGTDLQNAFPGIEGFSRTNIFRMRAFYLAYEKIPQAVGQLRDLPFFQIPWGHNAVLLEKLKKAEERLWYAQQTIQNGWSRAMLEIWIENNLYKRQGKAVTNFITTLPKPQSDLAHQTLKDPYNFDFISLTNKVLEKEVEDGLIEHIQQFLLELGAGFAFMGRQYPIQVEGETFYFDLLFYHVKLRCYVVIEIKTVEFQPEHAGKMNFYLSAADDILKSPEDQPSIGILLCKSKKKFKVEYALRDINKPIGVSGYETKIVESLPKKLKGSLPSIEEIEAEFKSKKKK